MDRLIDTDALESRHGFDCIHIPDPLVEDALDSLPRPSAHSPLQIFPRWVAPVSHEITMYGLGIPCSPLNSVQFYGLNLVRFITILSFILVLAGSFDVMVTDIIAVNKFYKESRESGHPAEEILGGCDYIKFRTSPPTVHTRCAQVC